MRYEERIAALVEKHITNRPDTPYLSTSDLLSALGCRNTGSTAHVVAFEAPAQPGPEYEALVLHTLLLALKSHLARRDLHCDENLSIIDGLMLNQRWRTCLNDIDTAYAFAALLTEGSLAPDVRWPVDPESNLSLKRTVEIDANTALQDWLPGVVQPLLQTEALVRAIFGNAWFDLVVVELGIRTNDLPGAILHLRPPFSPGLLAAHLEPVALTLPALTN